MATPDINALLRADPRFMRYGAPMGAVDHVCEDWSGDSPLHVQRVRLVDGDYGPDGTYWGASKKVGHVYCAFNTNAMRVRIYVRAFTRGGALRVLREKYPGLTFHRPTHTV